MKWVLIGSDHINMDNVRVFYWDNGVLYVDFVGKEYPSGVRDPHKEKYIKLCHLLGLRPVEDT